MRSPVCSHAVRPGSDTTAGSPSSRATMAECDSRLPRSTTTAGRGREQQDPAGIGAFGDQDVARHQQSAARIADDASDALDHAGAAADATALVVAERRLPARGCGGRRA